LWIVPLKQSGHSMLALEFEYAQLICEGRNAKFYNLDE
jgi:hypothetical protein